MIEKRHTTRKPRLFDSRETGGAFTVKERENEKMDNRYPIDNKDSNICYQDLTTEWDEFGKARYHLQTRVSLDEAIRQVQFDNERLGGRLGKGSDEVIIQAEIPLELWALDPLLKRAAFFREHGDIAHFTHYFKMFLDLQPQLAPDFQKRIYTVR